MKLQLKPGVTESQLNVLYEAIMGLGKLPMVESVSAGENFGSADRSLGYTFAFELVLTDLKAYHADAHHAHVRDTIINPLVAEGGFVSVDYEFPRGIASHHIGREVATPDLQRWDAAHANEDIVIDHETVSPKSDATIWRSIVAARPIRDHGYSEFVIERNPKPANRALQIGIVTRADLENVTQANKSFIDFKTGFAWQSNGGFVSGIDGLQEHVVPHVPWEHDHTVGVLVDLEKSVIQFFYDRKKIGPAVHLKTLGHEVFFAVSIDAPKTSIKAHWTASPPKVFLGN